MTVTLVGDRTAFAAQRKAVLDRAEQALEPVVREALSRYGQEQWFVTVRDAALEVWDQTLMAEYPEPSEVVDDLREAFAANLDDALARTSQPSDPPSDREVALLVRWLATLSVNDATATAASADIEVDLRLEWVSMKDSKVRETHRDADGQTIPVGGTFEVDGVQTPYPGAPVGPVELWINCRCLVAITGGDMGASTATVTGFTEEEVAALTAAAESDAVDPDAPTLPDDFDMGPMPCHGVLVAEGVPTGDRRKFAAGGLTWDRLPLPLRWQEIDQPGHDGSVVMARIDTITRVEATEVPGTFLLEFEGTFHDSPAASKVIDLIANQMLRGVSVDVDDTQMELQNADGTAFDMDSPSEERPIEVYNSGRIRSAAIVSIPAFAEAYIALGPKGEIAEVDDESLAASGEEFAPGTKDGPGWITHPRATQRITNYWVRGPGAAKIGWGAPNDFYRCRRQLSKYVQNPKWLDGLCANLHKRALGIWPGEHDGKMSVEVAESMDASLCTSCLESLTASAMQTPTEWFVDPALDGPTPLTVCDDGRVFGHIASWGVCHIGLSGACVTPPHSYRGYVDFHTHPWQTDAGMTQVGFLTMNTGHAGLDLSANRTMSHYDNTGTAFAAVRAGEDEHGIWVSGVLMPGLSEREDVIARSAAISGDWRSIGGNLELVAALAVNVPGFPLRNVALAASGGVQTALVAAYPVLRAQHEDIEGVVRETFAKIEAERARAERATKAKMAMRTARAEAARAVLSRER